MGTAEGLSKERMLEIEANCIIGGAVDLGTGKLMLERKNGMTVDAGVVRGPQGPAVSLLQAWPVGAVYISVSNAVAPGMLFGGTWVEFGKGRMLVGVDSTQTEFDSVEETGGAKTHTLTAAEMPNHTHGISGNISLFATGAAGGGTAENNGLSIAQGATGGRFQHPVAIAPTKVSDSAGSGAAHNNLPPYITVYMWKRTA